MQPQYLIPLLGMLLGNTISGISIGLAAVIEELSSGEGEPPGAAPRAAAAAQPLPPPDFRCCRRCHQMLALTHRR